MKRMPSAYACPVVPTSVMADICVAITDRPTAHQGRLRPARKNPVVSCERRLSLSPVQLTQPI